MGAATYELASYFFDPAFDTLYPATDTSNFGGHETGETQEEDDIDNDK